MMYVRASERSHSDSDSDFQNFDFSDIFSYKSNKCYLFLFHYIIRIIYDWQDVIVLCSQFFTFYFIFIPDLVELSPDPIGGANAPCRCLPTVKKQGEEEEDDEEEQEQRSASVMWLAQCQPGNTNGWSFCWIFLPITYSTWARETIEW